MTKNKRFLLSVITKYCVGKNFSAQYFVIFSDFHIDNTISWVYYICNVAPRGDCGYKFYVKQSGFTLTKKEEKEKR